ncbi:MAG: anti-sigma-factor antagonist [Actinomycetia bacterium]|jgi:anti-sigma B factor antagonist|nr:anti-sigma-factor antagonist [Actinomycetes bacterium]
MPFVDLTSSNESPGAYSVTARGTLDLATAPQLQAKLDKLIDDGAGLILLRLGDVEFLDSSGIRTIIGASRRLRDTGGRLMLAEASGAVQQVLEIAGVLSDLSAP